MKLLRILIIVAIVVLAPLLVFSLLRTRGGPAHEKSIPPTVVVEASYPGANARVVADTVAAPIEQQINGVEGMMNMQSHCSNDGKYTMVMSFAQGTDLSMAQALVQNRVALAVPVLPASVIQNGVIVRKKSPVVRAFLVLTSPDNRNDEIYLSNYAAIQLRDELARVAGVGDVEILGRRDYGIQIWLDDQALAARALSAVNVVKALQEQNLQPAGTPIEPNAEMKLNVTGRSQLPNELANVVVKTGPNGEKVFLRDVAHIELGSSGEIHDVRVDGKPAIALAIHPLAPDTDPKALKQSIESTVEQLGEHLPEGLALEFAFEFAPKTRPDALLVDVQLPDGASAARTEAVLRTCEAISSTIQGVTKTLTGLDDPFAASRPRPNLLLGIDPDQHGGREAIATDLRTRLSKEIPEAAFRINDLAAPGRTTPSGYPITFAICDASDHGYNALALIAESIARRLRESGKLTDVGVYPNGTDAPQLSFDIDREKAAELGLKVADIQTALQASLGGINVGGINQFGRTLQITVHNGGQDRNVEDMLELPVTGANGRTIALRAVATIRHMSGPAAVERVNLYPAIEISGNPATGVSLPEARALCDQIAQQEMPSGVRITWLSPLRK